MTALDSSVSLLVLEGLCRDMRARVQSQVLTGPRVMRKSPALRRLATRATMLLTFIGCLFITLAELQARM